MAGQRSNMIPTLLRICILFLFTARLGYAVTSVRGSPCEAVCADKVIGTIDQDVVCLENNFANSTAGQNYQKCVACQLNSTAVDSTTGETDVLWGLYHLRYTLSSCMFAVPRSHISISSPCQVSCNIVRDAITYQISNDTSRANPRLDFCTATSFADNDINTCAICYGYIPEQLYLANFLQALHIACRATPVAGRQFYPDGMAIFNNSLIAGPSPPSAPVVSTSALSGQKLAIAIAVPLIVGLLLLVGCCWGCFLFTRRRRQKMARSGRMSRVHHANAEMHEANTMAEISRTTYSPTINKMRAWGEKEPPREMTPIRPVSLQIPNATPRASHARFSYHSDTAASTHSFQTNGIGPGEGQVQDPNLHEQFFGVAVGGEPNESELDYQYPSAVHDLPRHGTPSHLHTHAHEVQRYSYPQTDAYEDPTPQQAQYGYEPSNDQQFEYEHDDRQYQYEQYDNQQYQYEQQHDHHYEYPAPQEPQYTYPPPQSYHPSHSPPVGFFSYDPDYPPPPAHVHEQQYRHVVRPPRTSSSRSTEAKKTPRIQINEV